MKRIRISTDGVPSDYRSSLVPLLMVSLGYQIEWVKPADADLRIIGPFVNLNAKKMRWLPKPLRKSVHQLEELASNRLDLRKSIPLRLFQTGENCRHDHVVADYSISHDLGVGSAWHFRMPYWMEMMDWAHEGVEGNANPRFGSLLKIEQLQCPLGLDFLSRSRKAILLSSHLREPRASCMLALQRSVDVDGLGPYFDKNIADHHSSGFLKRDVLQPYAFNLCPENGLYPGYITEKIPEAFMAGCLPITWVDESVSVDFNADAMINLKPMMQGNFAGLDEVVSSSARLSTFAEQPLLLHQPSIEGLKLFIRKVVGDAVS